MSKGQGKGEVIDIKGRLERDREFIRAAVRAAIEAALEAEMTEALGAEKGERTETRLGYRSGHYSRSLITRIGTLELRVPQHRSGRFSTELFARYQRSEKALVGALAERYVQGVSTRKVNAVTEVLCGHGFCASRSAPSTTSWTRRYAPLPSGGCASRIRI
jgi:putative transposase